MKVAKGKKNTKTSKELKKKKTDSCIFHRGDIKQKKLTNLDCLKKKKISQYPKLNTQLKYISKHIETEHNFKEAQKKKKK